MSDFGDQFGIFQILNVWFVLCYGCFFLKDAFFSHFLLAPSCYLLKSSACEEFAGLSSMLPLSESSAVGNLGEFCLGAVAAPVCRKFSSLGLGAKWAAASTTLACFDHRTCGNTLQWWMLCWGPLDINSVFCIFASCCTAAVPPPSLHVTRRCHSTCHNNPSCLSTSN